MATANIRAVITADDKASATLKGFGDNVSTLSDKIKTGLKVAAFAAGAAVATGLVANIDNAIRRVDILANSARVFDAMGFSAKDAGQAMKDLDKSIRGLPTPLDEAVKNVQMLAGATNDIKLSQKLFTALNNAVIGFGGTTEDVSNSVIQLSEAFSDARVDSNAWNSLIQNGLGPALNAMARSMGKTMGELKDGLSKGSISVTDFQNALIKMNKEGGGGLKSFELLAKEATGGIGTAWANMNTAIARSIASLINSIGRNNIAALITNIGVAFESSIKSIVSVARQIGDYLQPKLEALWNTINGSLIPALSNLWHNFIEPLLPVLGTALVLAIGAVVDILNGFLTGLSWVIKAINDGNPIILALIGLFGTLATAMAFNAVFNALTIGFHTLTLVTIPSVMASVTALRTLIASPVGFGGIVITAALIALQQVYDAANRARAAIEGANQAAVGGSESNAAVISRLRELMRTGTPEQKARASAALKGLAEGGSFASGTNYAPGGLSLVGERGPELVNLPRGSQVIPNNKISQAGGPNITFNVSVGMYAGSPMERRNIAKALFKDFQDVAHQFGIEPSSLLDGSNGAIIR